MRPLPQRVAGIRVEYLVGLLTMVLMAIPLTAPHLVDYPVDEYCKGIAGCQEVTVTKRRDMTEDGLHFRQAWKVYVDVKEAKKAGHSLQGVGVQLQNLADKRFDKLQKLVFMVETPVVNLVVSTDKKRGT